MRRQIRSAQRSRLAGHVSRRYAKSRQRWLGEPRPAQAFCAMKRAGRLAQAVSAPGVGNDRRRRAYSACGWRRKWSLPRDRADCGAAWPMRHPGCERQESRNSRLTTRWRHFDFASFGVVVSEDDNLGLPPLSAAARFSLLSEMLSHKSSGGRSSRG